MRSVHRAEMGKLVARGVIEIIGPIRQALLSGVRDRPQFQKLRDRLGIFSEPGIQLEDYKEAPTYDDRCRARLIQGPATDFLICAMAVRHDLVISTDDRDSLSY